MNKTKVVHGLSGLVKALFLAGWIYKQGLLRAFDGAFQFNLFQTIIVFFAISTVKDFAHFFAHETK
jgi:hypothetical protein